MKFKQPQGRCMSFMQVCLDVANGTASNSPRGPQLSKLRCPCNHFQQPYERESRQFSLSYGRVFLVE